MDILNEMPIKMIAMETSTSADNCRNINLIVFLRNFSTGKYKKYKEYFTVPYFIFVRDTLIYLALLGLHFAICFEPSQLPFSNLEWAILVFFLGRLFTEIKQVVDMAKTKSYLRYISLVLFFIYNGSSI